MAKKKKSKHPNIKPEDSKNNSEKRIQNQIKPKSRIAWPVFIFSIAIVGISLTSVVFPALVSTSTIPEVAFLESTQNPFEAGAWAAPLIIVDAAVLFFAMLYFKQRIPQSLSKKIESLFEFEVSKRVALITMIVFLAIYVASSAHELSQEEEYEDYLNVKKRLGTWSPENISSFEPHVRYFFLSSSMALFGNYRIVALVASAALVITLYLITKEVTQKRFAGLASSAILLTSPLFLTYDTTVAYTNFWILFYLLSLYFAIRFWPISPVLYLASIPAKALTAAFMPFSVFFILRSDIAKRKKLIISASIIVIVAIGGVAAATAAGFKTEEFSQNEFWLGFASFAYQLRFDGLVLLFLLPLVVGLFLAARKGVPYADSIMVLIAGMLIIAPFLTAYTNQTNQPYRFVPLVVFFAVGVGILLSKKTRLGEQKSTLK